MSNMFKDWKDMTPEQKQKLVDEQEAIKKSILDEQR